MNLVRVSENTIVNKDNIYALVGEQYNGRHYTYIYMAVGNKEKKFLVEGNVEDIEKLITETDNDGWYVDI